MKVSSKIPAVVNKQISAAKASTSNGVPKETDKGDASRKAPNLPGNSKLGSKKMPPNPELNNILRADTHGSTMTLRRSYGMVVSGFEHVAKKQQLTSEAAEQFSKTVDIRIRELNSESISKIKDLPEYKSFALDEISDMMQDHKNYLKAFALLKNPVFAELMESTESVHRSFAEVMKDNGEEKMMFGILDMIKDFGGLVGFQEETQINQNNSSVNIRA